MSVDVLATRGGTADGASELVRAGSLLFTASFEGSAHDGGALGQCERVYENICDLIPRAGPGAAVTRLEHLVDSQGWLLARQRLRARFFGYPASTTSTGVQGALPSGCSISAAAIAATESARAELLVPGTDYGMPFLATAIRAGSLVFVSGLTTVLARQASGLADPIGALLASIGSALRQAGTSEQNIVRQDIFACDEPIAQLVLDREAELWPAARPSSTWLEVHFGADEIAEVTVIASLPGDDLARTIADGPSSGLWGSERGCPSAVTAGGYVFTGQWRAPVAPDDPIAGIDRALQRVGADLERLSVDPADIARVDVTVPVPDLAALVAPRVSACLPRTRAVTVLRFPASPSWARGVAVSAIARQPTAGTRPDEN